MNMRSNILLHCDQKIQKENRTETIYIYKKILTIYYKKKTKSGKRNINK
jgi:hypothetical protein